MGNRLLLADDSITIQKVVAIIFANEEFELTVVDNGIAALQKAREVRPDVMLVDALMPGKTGYEVCAEIRRDPQLSSIPILLLIGAFEPFDEEKSRNCGADASITKPFESQQLIDRVKELLELGKTRAAPAPAALPLPAESAEELWGDLSSFDTMPPPDLSVAPVAAPVAPAPVAPVPVTPALALQADPFAAAPFRAPAAPAPAAEVAQSAPAPREPIPAPEPEAASEEILEASLEDDLWGAFDLEEVPEVAVAAPATGSGPVEPESRFEAEEFFSFEDEAETIEETGPTLDLEAAVEKPAQQPSAEELFSFAEEPPLSVAPASEPEPLELPAYEPLPSIPEAAAPVAPVPPEAPPVAQSAPVSQPEVSEAAESAAKPGTFALSEAELTAALTRISREVIERIVWEVVPDLAEVLIKEEIRKLKAGITG